MDEEEVVDMKEGTDGVHHPVAVVKIHKNPPPTHTEAHIPRRMSVLLELVDGFSMGLGAMENFIRNVRKFDKRRK